MSWMNRLGWVFCVVALACGGLLIGCAHKNYNTVKAFPSHVADVMDKPQILTATDIGSFHPILKRKFAIFLVDFYTPAFVTAAKENRDKLLQLGWKVYFLGDPISDQGFPENPSSVKQAVLDRLVGVQEGEQVTLFILGHGGELKAPAAGYQAYSVYLDFGLDLPYPADEYELMLAHNMAVSTKPHGAGKNNLKVSDLVEIAQYAETRGLKLAIVSSSCYSGATVTAFNEMPLLPWLTVKSPYARPDLCVIVSSGIENAGSGTTAGNLDKAYSKGTDFSTFADNMSDIKKSVRTEILFQDDALMRPLSTDKGFRSGCLQTLAMRDLLELNLYAFNPGAGGTNFDNMDTKNRRSYVLRNPTSYLRWPVVPDGPMPVEAKEGRFRAYRRWFEDTVQAFYEHYKDNWPASKWGSDYFKNADHFKKTMDDLIDVSKQENDLLDELEQLLSDSVVSYEKSYEEVPGTTPNASVLGKKVRSVSVDEALRRTLATCTTVCVDCPGPAKAFFDLACTFPPTEIKPWLEKLCAEGNQTVCPVKEALDKLHELAQRKAELTIHMAEDLLPPFERGCTSPCDSFTF